VTLPAQNLAYADRGGARAVSRPKRRTMDAAADAAQTILGDGKRRSLAMGVPVPPGEVGCPGVALNACKLEQPWATLRQHRGLLCVAARLCRGRTFIDSEPQCAYGS